MSTDKSNCFFSKGDVFHDYVVKRLIGRGSFGSVYLVFHPALDMQYALKVLDASAAVKDEMGVERFLREARLATRIHHPNLVSVHDCGFDEALKVYYLVMDYAEGCTLREVLRFEKKLDVVRATKIVEQIARAMLATQPFHIVHRDIKPENIMMGSDGCVRLLDLGIAKAISADDAVKTRAGCMLGTPAYISPEQALNSADVDVRADIYSLGVVFYEMLAGRRPYEGRTQTEVLSQVISEDPPPDVCAVVPSVNAEIACIIRRMMEKDRDKRIASFDEVLAELHATPDKVAAKETAEPPPPHEDHPAIFERLSRYFHKTHV